jgi:hypothetical protein
MIMKTTVKQVGSNKDKVTLHCTCVGSVDTTKGYEGFLDNAYIAVRELWHYYGGDDIGEHEEQTLRNHLDDFFGDKR